MDSLSFISQKLNMLSSLLTRKLATAALLVQIWFEIALVSIWFLYSQANQGIDDLESASSSSHVRNPNRGGKRRHRPSHLDLSSCHRRNDPRYIIYTTVDSPFKTPATELVRNADPFLKVTCCGATHTQTPQERMVRG